LRLKLSLSHKGKKYKKYKKWKHSDEAKKKISDALKRRHPMSEETKAKIALSRKGLRCSEESKKKMSLAKKGRFMPWLYTPEALAKRSKTTKGRKFSLEHREKLKMSWALRHKKPLVNNHEETFAEVDKHAI